MANTETILNWYREKLQDPQELLSYLSGTSTLHWFDRVIEGRINIIRFIKSKMTNFQHVMKNSKAMENSNNFDEDLPDVYINSGKGIKDCVTPEKNVSSVIILSKPNEPMEMDVDDFEEASANMANAPVRQVRNVNWRGVLKLGKKSNRRVYDRPFKLTISYTGDFEKDFCIKQIVYSDCTTCRKSLLAAFDGCFDDEGFISESSN